MEAEMCEPPWRLFNDGPILVEPSCGGPLISTMAKMVVVRPDGDRVPDLPHLNTNPDDFSYYHAVRWPDVTPLDFRRHMENVLDEAKRDTRRDGTGRWSAIFDRSLTRYDIHEGGRKAPTRSQYLIPPAKRKVIDELVEHFEEKVPPFLLLVCHV